MKNEANTAKEKLEKEVSDLKSELKEQNDKYSSLAQDVEDRVLAKTQSHFNEFTRHMEHAFVREQASSHKHNLIVSGINENAQPSDFVKFRNICTSQLGLKQLAIATVYRLGSGKAPSARPRPLLVRFNSFKDRKRYGKRKRNYNVALDVTYGSRKICPKLFERTFVSS